MQKSAPFFLLFFLSTCLMFSACENVNTSGDTGKTGTTTKSQPIRVCQDSIPFDTAFGTGNSLDFYWETVKRDDGYSSARRASREAGGGLTIVVLENIGGGGDSDVDPLPVLVLYRPNTCGLKANELFRAEGDQVNLFRCGDILKVIKTESGKQSCVQEIDMAYEGCDFCLHRGTTGAGKQFVSVSGDSTCKAILSTCKTP